jgi:hypothetical protein
MRPGSSRSAETSGSTGAEGRGRPSGSRSTARPAITSSTPNTPSKAPRGTSRTSKAAIAAPGMLAAANNPAAKKSMRPMRT